MRLLPALLLALAAVPQVLAQDAPPAPDFTITLAADGSVAIQAATSAAVVTDAGGVAGRERAFHVTVSEDYAIGEVRVQGFDVSQVRQILPLWRNRTGLVDDHFFGEVRWLDFEAHHLVNFSGTPGDARIRVGFPGPSEKTLVLQRDVRAPDFRVGEPRNLTQIGFLLTTRTDEYALADLQIRRAGSGGEWIQNPTTVPALEQTFPIQGLNPDTEYEYRIRIWDVPGNEAWSDLRTVTTPPAVVVPPPVLRVVAPAPEATLDSRKPVIRVAVTSPSAVEANGVRVFLDLKEVLSGIEFDGANVTYAVGDELKRGLHRVAVEVRNVEGGLARETWTFTVSSLVVPLPAWLLPAALAAVAAAGRRR